MRSSQEERTVILHHCHPHLCQMAQSFLYDTKQNEQMRHQYVIGFQNRRLCEGWHEYRHKEKHFSFKGHCGSGLPPPLQKGRGGGHVDPFSMKSTST